MCFVDNSAGEAAWKAGHKCLCLKNREENLIYIKTADLVTKSLKYWNKTA